MENRADTLQMPPLIDENGEIREITDADLKRFKPAKEVLPPDVYAMLTAPKKSRMAGQATRPLQTVRHARPDPAATFAPDGKD